MKTKFKSIFIFLLPVFILLSGSVAKADTYWNNTGNFPCYNPNVPGGNENNNDECLVTFQTNKLVYELGEEVFGYLSVTSGTGLGLDPYTSGFIVMSSHINYAPYQIPGSIIPNLAYNMSYSVGTSTLTGNYEFVISLSLPNTAGILEDVSSLFYVNGIEAGGGGNENPVVNVR